MNPLCQCGCGQRVFRPSSRFLKGHVLRLRAEKSINWKGGRIASCGYVLISRADLPAGKPRAEHRLVLERKLGRKLLPSEHVHHKNGNKADNREENLELLTVNEHTRRHMVEGGRWRGVKNVNAKLNPAKAKQMRTLYSKGMTSYELADLFEVAQSTAWEVIRGRTWRSND